MERKIKKVLIANRGEIAIRIIRACYDLGLRTVSIYSKEDSTNLFRTKADESYLVGEGKGPLAAYLDIDRIVSLAVEKGVDAIHPGYGFLSENADFARACEQAGIIFIGPPSHVLAQMGDKLAAKEIAKRAGVKTIPGSKAPITDVQQAVRLANEFGYPVILKAAAGGGGKGMRRANNDEELRAAFDLVGSEALKSFGNGDIFLEKFIEQPKHIEVQVLGDQYGNIVHLYELSLIHIFPVSQAVGLFRQVMMAEPLAIGLAGAPQAAVAEFRQMLGVDYVFGQHTLTALQSVLILLATAVVFYALSVWRMRRKKR